MYAPNVVSEHQAFVNDVYNDLQRVGSTESNPFVVFQCTHWNRQWSMEKAFLASMEIADPVFNENGWYLFQLCCSNELCIMTTHF